jgi:hypothetical protein
MSQMTKWGMPGVYTHAFMDGWSPGYLGSVSYNHNGIMKMYETQSGRDLDSIPSPPAAGGAGAGGEAEGGRGGGTAGGGRGGAAEGGRGGAPTGGPGGGRGGAVPTGRGGAQDR